MRNNLLPLLTAAVLCSALPCHASVRSDIERQYKRWAKAALTNDVDTILEVLSPEYTLRTYAGQTILRKDYEASLRKRKAANQPSSAYETKIVSLEVKGETAMVISDETSEKDSVDPITNKKVKLIHLHRYLDTWVKMGRAWRLRSTYTQTESTKLG